MRYTQNILDEIKNRILVSQIVGRKVLLKKRGREWVGLSPFKVEKTPSFFVNDQKGFYHCFATGEHGDIFTFLIKSEGLSFPEAVERLASEAGVSLPKVDTKDHENYDKRERLLSLLENAVAFFEEQFSLKQGSEALRYLLEKRGLTQDTIKKFRLGFALNSRHTLLNHLKKSGFKEEEMIASGMLIAGEDIKEPYDRFRNRVMFPITDIKGRTIAFGGRSLDPEAQAKYLNSPETPLFHKGHTLYNAHKARSFAHERQRLIVVEGYMDVVALTEGGFSESVAPLGTALTADQIGLLWKINSEPILCFDGDLAGKKAAARSIDTFLPLLKPGFSTRFAFLPDGLDPDDLIRQQGPKAMEAILDSSLPLAEVLFDREWTQGEWSTPERRARLEQQMMGLVARIGDPKVRVQYEEEMLRRLSAAWGQNGPTYRRRGSASSSEFGQRDVGSRGRSSAQSSIFKRNGEVQSKDLRFYGEKGLDQRRGHATASSSLQKSLLVKGDSAHPSYRELLILRGVLNHPWIAIENPEVLARIDLKSPALRRLRDMILDAVTLDNSLDSEALRTHVKSKGLSAIIDHVDRSVTHKCDKFAERDTQRFEVEVGWRHALALHERQVGLQMALERAERAWHEDKDHEAYQSICEIQAELERLTKINADLDATQKQDTTVL